MEIKYRTQATYYKRGPSGRQTTLIRDFAKTYEHAIVLNLEKPSERRYFEDFDDVQTIVDALFSAFNIPSSAITNTLLFIDEIQESPKAI